MNKLRHPTVIVMLSLLLGCAEAKTWNHDMFPDDTDHENGQNPTETPVIPGPVNPETPSTDNPPKPEIEEVTPVTPEPEPDPDPVDTPPVDTPPEVPPDTPPVEEPDNTPDYAPIEDSVDGVPVLPITYRPYTTLQLTHRPTIGNQNYPADRVMELIQAREFKATDLSKYKKFSLGVTESDPEPWILRQTLLKATDPKLSHKGKSLAYFWQISDPQLTDEESPCRLEGVNIYPYLRASAYRPQGFLSPHMFDLHVQTAKRISDMSKRPFDFALVTGDVADNAQKNEMKWFQRMMGGGVLNPDSGVDDDPVEGPGNDFNDPFYSRGLGDIPWYPAIGNHDILYMGFTVIDDRIRAACTGDEVVDLFDYLGYLGLPQHAYRDGYQNGYRDGSTPDGVVVTSGKTPADPDRALMTKIEALQAFHDALGLPAGHGLDPDIMKQGWGYYSVYPIPGKPIRLITLDTNADYEHDSTMTSAVVWKQNGSMTNAQFEWLKSQIEDAKSKKELVLVQSHHGTADMTGSITQDTFRSLLASYEGVILHITGHGHYNTSSVYKQGLKGYWEVMLASVVDFPSQTRIFEIVYEGDGIISIYITNLDYNAPENTMGADALHYSAGRRFFRNNYDPINHWDEEKEHRNLILRTRIPKEVADNIEQYEWSDIIESEETLNKFEYHSN